MHRTLRPLFVCFVTTVILTVTAPKLGAQLGDWVKWQQRISDTQGNFGGVLDNGDTFGIAIANLGDLTGDGMTEIAVGAQFDDDGGTDRGAIWILTLNATGTVFAETKISDTAGSFTGALGNGDLFGHALTAIGDLDGDGVIDLATSSLFDDDGGLDRGAVWVLFLNDDGSVKAHQKISATVGGFTGVLDNNDAFGIELEGPGDLDGDGVLDLLVGATNDDDGGADRGALWILYLNTNGTVKAHAKISQTSGGFLGALANGDRFGAGIATIGDLDGDGIGDLAVGSHASDEGGNDTGSVWILFLAADETVASAQKISATHGGFGGVLAAFDIFGLNLSRVGDLDGDGRDELGVSAVLDDTRGNDRGALWILFLDTDGTVRHEVKLASGTGGLGGVIRNDDHFGRPELLGDVNGDGVLDIAVGATGTNDGGTDRGAVWILFLNRCTSASAVTRNGGGGNPMILASTGPPLVGANWDLTLDATGYAPGNAFLIGTSEPASGKSIASGELLIDLMSPKLVCLVAPHTGAPTAISLGVPNDLSLCGATASFQALVSGIALTNAIDAVVGP